MASRPRFDLKSETLLFERVGTRGEKGFTIVLFVLGVLLLCLLLDGDWGGLTGFTHNYGSYACAFYLMAAPCWGFLGHSILMHKSNPIIEVSDGWGFLRWRRKINKDNLRKMAIVTHDRLGFRKNKLSHSLILFGQGDPLFIFRANDFRSAQDTARRFSSWMNVRLSDQRGINWSPSPWISRYNRIVMVVLFLLTLWDWLS